MSKSNGPDIGAIALFCGLEPNASYGLLRGFVLENASKAARICRDCLGTALANYLGLEGNVRPGSARAWRRLAGSESAEAEFYGLRAVRIEEPVDQA